MASAVFFLRHRLLFGHGAPAADLFVDRKQFADQLLEVTKLSHLALGLLQGGGTGKRLRYSPSLPLAGQPKVRAVARVVGFVAVAVGLPAATADAGDGSAAEVAQDQTHKKETAQAPTFLSHTPEN